MKPLPFLLALLFAAFGQAADVPVKFLSMKDMKRDDPRFESVLNNIRSDEQNKHSGAERTFTIVQNFGKSTYLVLMDDGKAAVVDNLGGAHADQDQVRAAITNTGKLYEYASTSGANRTRTRCARVRLEQLAKIEVQILPDIIEAYGADPSAIDPAEMAKEIQLQGLLDSNRINDDAGILYRHMWTLESPAEGESFLTSDYPVTMHNQAGSRHRPRRGIAAGGIEICFPLSPRLILVLRERIALQDAEPFDGKWHKQLAEECESMPRASMGTNVGYRHVSTGGGFSIWDSSAS